MAAGSTRADEIAAQNRGEIETLLDAMESAWATIDDYTARVEKTERLVDGKMTRQTIFVKYRKPGLYYMKVLEGPNKGGELIYPSHEGSSLAVAHAGGFKGGFARFLTKTVVLRRVVPSEFALDDPLIGKYQHQTVVDTSFGAIIARVASNLRDALQRGEGRVAVDRDCPWESDCPYRLEFELPAAGETHVTRDGETLWSIAAQYGQPMYVIWYHNPDIKDPEKLSAGRELFIPRYYANHGIITIPADTLMPTRLEVYDARGELYEHYVYSDVRIDVGLADIDFDAQNPDYRF